MVPLFYLSQLNTFVATLTKCFSSFKDTTNLQKPATVGSFYTALSVIVCAATLSFSQLLHCENVQRANKQSLQCTEPLNYSRDTPGLLGASDELLALQNMHNVYASTQLYWHAAAPEEKVWWGFSLFVTTVQRTCRFPASGSILVPTHRRLPEIKTSWVCRVEQEGLNTERSGRVWGVWG